MGQINPNVGKFTKPKPHDISGIRVNNVFENYGLKDMDTTMSQKPTFDYKPPAPVASMSARPPASTGDEPTPSIQELMDQLGGFENTDRDEFRRSIQEMPTLEQNKPSIARRLVASGMGFGAKTNRLETMDSVLDKPYKDKLEEWKAKVEPRYKSAQLENTANANERQLRGNILTNQVNAKRYDQQYEVGQERNEIARMKADVDVLKSKGWTVKVEGANVVGYGPPKADGTPPERRVLGSSGGMNERDKIILEGMYDIATQQQRVNSIAANQQAAGADFYVTPQGNLVPGNPRSNPPVIPPPGSRRPGTVSSPAPKNRAEKNREIQFNMDNLYRTSPADKRWLIAKGDGTYTPRPRPIVGQKDNRTTTMGFGGTAYTQDDVDAYDATMQAADPEYKPPAAPTAKVATGQTTGVGPGTVPANGRGAPPPAAGRGTGYGTPAASKPRLRVYDPVNKRYGSIPNTEEEINNAMKQGWRVEAGGQ